MNTSTGPGNPKRKNRTIRFAINCFLFVIGLFILSAGFVYWYDKSGQKPDLKFDVSVQAPAYTREHPTILFDVAHNNYHTPSGRYQPFAKLLENDGYIIRENTKPFEISVLDSFSILVVANAMGPGEHEGGDAFTAEEDSAVVQWVRNGGALLLIADHAPFGSAASNLSKCFGVEMNLRFASDDDNHAGWDNEKLIFSHENNLLTDCPITRGRNSSENVCSVITFTGQSLKVPPGATLVLRMGDNSYDWESSDIRFPAKGNAQCISMLFGKGRVVILGEAGVLSAQVDPLGFKMGMNYGESCNKQFALNILHWLSGSLN